MAGEIEDCISIQAECLPTGSISFGRFELESLSWERRSSFSHNRYLEEVERFSTPGSVTQKRAILEAHFKKRPLQPQTSPEDLNEGQCQTTEDRSCCASYDSGCEDVYDEMPTDSDEHKLLKSEPEEMLLPKFPTEATPCMNEKVVEPTCELSDHEILQHQFEDDSVKPKKDDLCIVAEHEPHNKGVIIEELLEQKEVVIVEESVEKRDVPYVGSIVGKKSVPSLKKNPQKAPPEGPVQRPSKIKSKSQLPVQKNLRKAKVERSYVPPSKMLSKSTGKLEREDASRTKSLRQLPVRTLRPTSSDSKNTKLEASVDMRAKQQGSRSEKAARAKKNCIMPHSISRRSEMDFHQSVYRPRQVADAAKEETKRKGAGFNFRSDERAEKRKEYFMKLEEKLHAKEAEMSEIQVRTQEEREAALKQLRRGLNFKATPMPSFYHEAVPRISEEKKKITTPSKPQKLQSKSTSPGSQTFREKSPLISNRETPSNSELKQASGSTKSSETMKKDERSKLNAGGSNSRRKGEFLDRVRRGGIVGGSVAVHVAY